MAQLRMVEDFAFYILVHIAALQELDRCKIVGLEIFAQIHKAKSSSA